MEEENNCLKVNPPSNPINNDLNSDDYIEKMANGIYLWARFQNGAVKASDIKATFMEIHPNKIQSCIDFLLEQGKFKIKDDSRSSRVTLYEVAIIDLPCDYLSLDTKSESESNSAINSTEIIENINLDNTKRSKKRKSDQEVNVKENNFKLSPPKILFLQESKIKCDIPESYLEFVMLLLSSSIGSEDSITIDRLCSKIVSSDNSDKLTIENKINEIIKYLESTNKVLLDDQNIYLI